jgi:hypothetical protein
MCHIARLTFDLWAARNGRRKESRTNVLWSKIPAIRGTMRRELLPCSGSWAEDLGGHLDSEMADAERMLKHEDKQ